MGKRGKKMANGDLEGVWVDLFVFLLQHTPGSITLAEIQCGGMEAG